MHTYTHTHTHTSTRPFIQTSTWGLGQPPAALGALMQAGAATTQHQEGLVMRVDDAVGERRPVPTVL